MNCVKGKRWYPRPESNRHALPSQDSRFTKLRTGVKMVWSPGIRPERPSWIVSRGRVQAALWATLTALLRTRDRDVPQRLNSTVYPYRGAQRGSRTPKPCGACS